MYHNDKEDDHQPLRQDAAARMADSVLSVVDEGGSVAAVLAGLLLEGGLTLKDLGKVWAGIYIFLNKYFL